MGFVSNSSSSSFCIYGDVIKSQIFPMGTDTEELMNLVPELYVHWDEWEPGFYYVGMLFNQMKDDETFKQFKERTNNNLTRIK